MKTKIVILVGFIFILAACGPSRKVMQGQFAQTLTAIPPIFQTPFAQTLTAIPPIILVQKETVIVQQVVTKIHVSEKIEYRVVTATFSGPTETPTIANTPIPRNKMDKSPGSYLVPDEISPGNWRSMGSSEKCYWEIRNATGDIMNNHFGDAGGTMNVPQNAFVVQLDKECGKWVFIK